MTKISAHTRFASFMCVAAYFLSAPATASNWIKVGSSDDALAYVDVESIAPRGPHMLAWVMWDYFEDQSVSGEPKKVYRSSKMLNHYDCSLRQSSLIRGVLYAGDGGSGATVLSATIAHKEFTDPVPDSVGEKLLKFVCDRSPKRR